eukprot:TRINITY_DN9770_c0_g1_i3.p4 TRINITY_DN9770_c0_g1~~TRINITY_DN9770_c0_g1_i3.p4  ORF type:complete len:120 (+),score=29.80 TRINITY_DN9770_c0_g1_i3:211-570(+)
MGKIIRDPNAKSEEKEGATETAIGALGKICYFHFDGTLVTYPLFHEFLSLLPITSDKEEAQNAHHIFLEQILAKNPIIFSPESEIQVKQTLIKIREEANKNSDILKAGDMSVLSSVLNQ